ncbi:MAG: ABC transporter permease [Acidobacteriaceae bacterium]|nr:ABC transporter permease [Acidobacteriaceae bacterium]
MRELWRRLRWFAHRTEFERDLEEEMRHHLALKAENAGNGTAANRQFGNVTLLKERSRAMWTGVFAEQVVQDIRYALRAMQGNKLFTALAIVSLALGIGANTAIYSFMDAILIRAMPVKQPEQLAILLWSTTKEWPAVAHDQDGTAYGEPGRGTTSPNYPYPSYEFLRTNNRVFSTLFGYAQAGRLNVVIDGQAQLGQGQYVSGNYFSGLGIEPAAGRLIAPDDDRLGAAPIVTIAYDLWQQRFGGRADAVGKTILINGAAFVITGITPPEFYGVEPQSAPVVFIPIHDLSIVNTNRDFDMKKAFADGNAYWIEMMARLKPGITLAQAQTETAAQFQQWVAHTATTEKERATLPHLWLQEGKSGVDALRREYSKALYTLMTMVALILTIACANLANLLLARATARRREIAVRLSLGAGRLRVIRQLLTESLLLSLFGGLLGMFLGSAGVRFLTLLLANGNPNFTLRAQLDWRVLAFTLAITFLAGLLFGIAPAIQATKVDVTPALKETRASSATARKRHFGLRVGASHVLVTSQIAISLVLVAAAGLFVRTLENLHSVDIGFNRDRLLVFDLNAATAGYKDAELPGFYDELRRRFAALPGVRSATVADIALISDSTSSTDVKIPGAPVVEGQRASTSHVRIGPDFFQTLQIPLLAGRPIDDRDRVGVPGAAVVNEVFAKKFFPGQWPIGRRFALSAVRTGTGFEIVGIARTTRYSSLKGEIPPVVYTSYLQTPKTWPFQHAYFELRTAGDPLALAETVRRIVHDVAPQVPIAHITTQSKIIEQTIVHERTFASLCACFGALALLMACVGLYATQAYAVTRRTGEIGIRMALGAERRRVVWMVVREVLLLSVAGVLIGLVAVWQTTTLLESFLFGLKAHDALTFEGAAAILMLSAVLASYGPARRAARVDPMVALRHE